MSHAEGQELGKFKLDSNGNEVDITKADRKTLLAIREHYQKKANLARSKDMKIAFQQCVDQIDEYLFEGIKPRGPDIFYLARYMGLEDVRGMIKRYHGHLESREERARQIINSHFSQRKVPYEKAFLPSDYALRRIFADLWHKPPLLQEAADEFTKDYQVRPLLVISKSSDSFVWYNFERGEVHVSLDKAEHQLGLLEALSTGGFEHLCNCNSWSFDSNPDLSFQKQRDEARNYVKRVFGRCVKLGLLPPPPDGTSLPDE